MSRHGAENDQRLPGEAFCADCPDREGCSQAVPCWLARQAAGMPRERHIIPPEVGSHAWFANRASAGYFEDADESFIPPADGGNDE